MTCEEAEKLVMPYIRDELTDNELEAFLEHVEGCGSCREELEIYFMVDVGLRQLDHDCGTYDITGELERKIEDSYNRVRNILRMRICTYGINTLGVMSLIVTILLQCRIWWQFGIFG